MTDAPQEKTCPQCGAPNGGAELPAREYRCARCGLELAHLDTAANGAIRGLFGWLLDVGEVVNERYRVVAVLGKGGFGVTYLVDDQRLHGKRRALKEIPELLFDEHETKLLGRLSHPAIPDIIDRFVTGGMVYLVLEFGGSRTLRIEQQHRGGRIPVFTLLPWIHQICDALIYLHSQDPPVVHRDLKPENLLLDDNNRVMLIDFGIAKAASSDTATRTLGRAVTHGFSPPEQVLGTGTDARSDVYAMGAIVYSMLTGKTPTPAHERVTGKVLEPVSSVIPDIPPLLDSAINQALELNINLRQQSIQEFAGALDLVHSGSGSTPTVFVTGAADIAARASTGAELRLPSIQLPSTRSPIESQGVGDRRISVPSVSERRAGWGGRLAVGLSAVGLALAAGVWVMLERGGWRGEGKDQVTDAETSAADVRVKAEKAPAATEIEPAPETSVVRVPPPEMRDVAGAEPPSATDPQGVTPVPLADRQPPPSTQDMLKNETPAAASKAGLAADRQALDASVPEAAAAVPVLTPSQSPRWSAADLPSIFSDEQAVVTSGERDSGSLMDMFDKHRGKHSTDAEPEASNEPAQAAASPLPDPKPKTVAKPRPKQAATTTKKPSSGGTSSWTLIYKGARKTD